MATERLSMRHTREILRQKWALGGTHRAVAQSLGVSVGTVGTTEKGTGHHLGPNLVILRGHGSNSSASPPGDVGRHEGWAAHGALGAPAGIAGVRPGILARDQQCSVVSSPDLPIGAQRQIARMKRDYLIRRPEGVGRATRPGVGGGIVHQAGPHGVSIQIPERGQRIGVLLDETGTVAPLPEVAPPPARLVERPGRFGHEPPERSAERIVRGRLEKQVHVVRHQGI